MDFSGFDFSDYFAGAGRRRRGSHGADRRRGGGFRDIFSQFFGGGGAAQEPAGAPEKGARPRVRAEHRFLAGHPRHAGARSTSPATRSAAPATAPGRPARASVDLPAVQGHRQRHPDGRRHEVQSHLPALRRQRASCATPAPPATATAASRAPRRWTSASRRARRTARACACPARATPAPWARPRAISTSPHAWRSIRSSTATATTSRSSVPVTVWEAGAGRQDRGAHHRRPHAAEDSARARRTARSFRLREKGVFNSRTNQRGDQIVEVAIQAPELRDERTRELLRELAKLHPEDPRAEMWSKV